MSPKRWSTRRIVLLLAALTPVVLAGLVWMSRDRIAIALMASEIEHGVPLKKISLPAVDASVLENALLCETTMPDGSRADRDC